MLKCTAAFWGDNREQKVLQGYVQPAPPQNPIVSSPWFLKVPVAIVTFSLVLRLFKRLTRGG